MNKDLTIVFSSYQSQHLLNKIIGKFNKKYKILVIENSLDTKVKKILESKFKNTEVIIPNKNLGLAKSYNLAIRKSKTNYVFLNNPDIEINNQEIKNLMICAKKIKKFGIISPTYKNERIYKNYEINSFKEKNNSKIFNKFGIIEVDLIDNNFLISKKNIKKNLFDENYFLYFETCDFALNLKNMLQKKLSLNILVRNHYRQNMIYL